MALMPTEMAEQHHLLLKGVYPISRKTGELPPFHQMSAKRASFGKIKQKLA
jgi:hypothetical protein